MIHFEWPWLLITLPLPIVVYWLVPSKISVEQSALKVPFLEDFLEAKAETTTQAKQWPLWLATIAWILFVLACARPQWLGEPVEQAISGRDLMLAVDLSASMEEQDFFINKQAVDRLTAIKSVASDFINRRVGDRVTPDDDELVGAGDSAGVACDLAATFGAEPGCAGQTTEHSGAASYGPDSVCFSLAHSCTPMVDLIA